MRRTLPRSDDGAAGAGEAAPAVRNAPAPSGDVIIQFQGVSKHYLDQAEHRHALIGIDLSVRAGEVFGVIGRSGAGKSTLIRTINRLEDINAGSLLVEGVDIATLSHGELVGLRRRIGMVFQHFNLLASRTVFENIALPLRVAGVPRAEVDRKVRSLLALVGLPDKGAAYPSQISGGQKQRVGIARALVHDPHILLCDEATSALDPETTQSILALLKSINRRLGLTIVLITHEMSVVRQICDRVAVLEQGRIVETGRVWEVFGAPQHAATRALLEPLTKDYESVDLPADLAATPQGEGGHAVVALHYEGLAAPPRLPALAVHGAVRLISAGVSRVQGHTYGRLLLAVPQDPTLLAQLQGQDAITMEVLGYVPSLA